MVTGNGLVSILAYNGWSIGVWPIVPFGPRELHSWQHTVDLDVAVHLTLK